MPGRKLRLAIFIAVTITGAILFARQRETGRRLQQQLRSLQQSGDLAPVVQPSERHSNRVVQINEPAPVAGDALNDLQRLRAEVKALRDQAKELNQLEADNRELSAQLTARQKSVRSEESPQEELPRESWMFTGYATPESALQSVMWAAAHGDVKAFAAGLPPELQSKLEAAGKNNSESEIAGRFTESQRTNGIGGFASYRILGGQSVSADESRMTIAIRLANGGMKIETMKLIKVENTWRVVGSVKNNAP